MRRFPFAPWLMTFLVALLLAGCGQSNSLALPQSPKGRTISKPGQSLAALVKDAKPGDRIVLGEGTFDGGVTLPPGVSLVGADPSKTIIEAKGSTFGLAVEGGSGVEIADLTIRNARQTNLAIRGASDVNVRRVQASGGITGINLERVTRGRVENSVASANRYGIVASGGESVTVVNCSIVANESLGLSFPSGSKTVAFNNLIVDGSVGVYLGEGASDARIDHNLYYTQFVGKQAGQVGRKSIGDWNTLTGQDGRSVRLAIKFADANRIGFGPYEGFDWNPGRAIVADWGTSDFAGIKAPLLDMAKRPRIGGYDVGAYDIARSDPGPLDGSFTIKADAGLKSAGVFTTDGRLVAYLFHNLPLTKGDYPYSLPGRDFQGRPISAGSYEVRVVESDLKWDYLGHVGDTGADAPASSTASVNPVRSSFTDQGVLVMQQGWSEDGANLRGYDSSTGKNLWVFEGRTDMLGLAIGDGAAYSLRASGTQGQITRLDPKTGKVAPIEGWPGGQIALEGGSKSSGFTVMDGQLFVADAATNRIRFAPIDKPSFEASFAVPSPTALAADTARHVLWTISGDRLIAFSVEGKKLAEAGPIPSPMALAAWDGRVAVASGVTGKIHFYNTSNLNEIKPDGSLGQDDGPAGPIAADRFPFKLANGWAATHVGLALGPKGELAVTERNRLIVFERDGKARWSTFGVFGNESKPSYSDPRRVYDTDGRISFLVDESKRTWSPESSRILPGGQADFLGDFASKAATFGVVLTPNASAPSRDVTVYRLDNPRPSPVSALIRDPSTQRYLSLLDTKSDGRIDLQDRKPDTPAIDGTSETFSRHTTLLPDGSLLTPGVGPASLAAIVPLANTNASSLPFYDLTHRREIPRPKDGLISPYTLQPEPNVELTAASPTEDGGIIANARLRSSPGGIGLFNNAGTDLIRFDAQGQPRWLHPLERHLGIEGLSTVGPVTITGVGVTSEILAFNPDGLGLGSFGPPAKVHYEGYYLDHPGAVRAYKGADGRTYALIADNYSGRHHWWRLIGVEAMVSTRFPLTIDTAKATNLAARPITKPRTLNRPSPPVVHIPRLANDLVIDGSLAKWRDAGITPQIIVTPETSSGAVQDPRDMSALVRLAYRGNDLYAQFLQFDDTVTFHQPVSRHYQHDGVELIINSYGSGFKFDATKTVDAGTIVIRSRFYLQNLETLLDPQQTPRSIRVLEDARDVPERSLIESVYGVDLSRCRVIVTEFKLPIDATTYRGSPETLFPMKPGQTFRLGLLINDNDEPGTDLQHYLVWPATYSNFGPSEDGALAILD